MIPEFDNRGYLPAAVHRATLEDVAGLFRHASELRRVEMQSLRWLVDLARRAGVSRLVVNGSFVTNIDEPNDVDCVLLVGPEFPRDATAEAELCAGLPFIEMQLVDEVGWNYMVSR